MTVETNDIRILYMDPNEKVRTLFANLFRQQGWDVVTSFERPEDVVEYLLSNTIHLFVINIDRLRDEQWFRKVRELCDRQYLSVVAISSETTEEERVRFVPYFDAIFTKPIHPRELVARMKAQIAAAALLRTRTFIHPLTGANNAHYIQVELQRQLTQLKRSHEPMSLVLLNIDKMAKLNRRYGYEFGDEIIRYFAQFIQHKVRPSDAFAHWTGQQFILILPQTLRQDARKLLTRLMRQFVEQPLMRNGEAVAATFSARILEVSNASMAAQSCLQQLLQWNGAEEEKSAIVDVTPTVSDVTMRKLNIAIIDDDRLIREMLVEQLRDIGDETFEITTRSFADGVAFFADEWHRENTRFILIIDRVMPKMDGLEVLHKIRTEYDRRKYLCIMLTSRDGEGDIITAIQRGANDYVTKPFSLKELRARIKRLIRGVS